jgi:hypothetical protein
MESCSVRGSKLTPTVILIAYKTETYPNAVVELHLLFIILVGIKRIEADTVMEELCPDL